MKQNIEIEVPQGFEAKYNKDSQKIEFIKITNKPRTWEEYCESLPASRKGYVISSPGQVIESSKLYGRYLGNFCETKEEVEAFLAMMQLRQLRKAWVKNWQPNFTGTKYSSYSIGVYNGEKKFHVVNQCLTSPLTFPTKEMGEEFVECFKDLLKKAKQLL